MLYAILAYHVESEVNSWSAEEDTALMANLRKAQLEAESKDFDFTIADFKRSQGLYEMGLIAKSEFDAVEQRMKAAEVNRMWGTSGEPVEEKAVVALDEDPRSGPDGWSRDLGEVRGLDPQRHRPHDGQRVADRLDHGVAARLVVAQHGLLGHMQTPIDTTYLADTVLVLRYFEAAGQVRRAMSVLKKRTGRHENTIREFSIESTGLKIGSPLDKFQGVLRGAPQYVGAQTDSKP